VDHDRIKHIEVPYHYIRCCIDSGKISIEHISTGEQFVDILTKLLNPRLELIGITLSMGLMKRDLREKQRERVITCSMA
jgi:hypothetical protein